MYFLSFYLKINPKWLHLQAIWKQDDPSHYYYHIILQSLIRQRSGSVFCIFWNTLKCKHFRQAPEAVFTVSPLHSCSESLWLPLGTSSPLHIRWTSLSMAGKYLTVTLRNMRAFDTLSMVLIQMPNDQHHNYITARDQSLFSAWWHRSYIQQVWNICATNCKGSSFSRWTQVEYTLGLVTAYLISKQCRWQKNSFISEVETNYRISKCVSIFFPKFSRCYKIWSSLTSVHSESSHYSNSPSPLPKHFETNSNHLRMRIWKTVCFTESGQAPQRRLPNFYFFF